MSCSDGRFAPAIDTPPAPRNVKHVHRVGVRRKWNTGIGCRQRIQFATLITMRRRTCANWRKASPLQLEYPMNSENQTKRNPFGVMDVPDPNDADVTQFARSTTLAGSADDVNAAGWGAAGGASQPDTIEGDWSSRWNGGVDPTIAGDAADKWKRGRGEARIAGDRVYLYFDWDSGARKGLIDAKREGPQRLVGKYINLASPAITRPWIGLIVDNQRIDGRFPEGRIDFRR
jgi:hypothetical protein